MNGNNRSPQRDVKSAINHDQSNHLLCFPLNGVIQSSFRWTAGSTTKSPFGQKYCSWWEGEKIITKVHSTVTLVFRALNNRGRHCFLRRALLSTCNHAGRQTTVWSLVNQNAMGAGRDWCNCLGTKGQCIILTYSKRAFQQIYIWHLLNSLHSFTGIAKTMKTKLTSAIRS